jgi:hypothetical protein
MQNHTLVFYRRLMRLAVTVLLGGAVWLWMGASSAYSLPAASRQEPVKIGSLKFTPPKDWSPLAATSRLFLAFAPPDLPKGKLCQVRVYAEEVSQETFGAWFTRRWNALMSGKPKLRASDVLTRKDGALDLMVRSGAFQEGSGESYALIMAVSLQGHFMLVSYEANDYPLIEQHQDEIYAMFTTMDLDIAGKAQADNAGAAKPSGQNQPGSVPNRKPGSSPAYTRGDLKQEAGRINRLSEIAHLLQNPKADTVTLLTEAARLCGFAIWTEDRTKIADPSGAPRLKLAVTDTEIRDYSEMFRRRDTVVLNDLIAMLDVVYKGIGSEPSCGPLVLNWLENGGRSGNPSVRALTTFIQSLSAFRQGGSASVFETGKETLDPIQALLILRVLTEEMGGALRKANVREKQALVLASFRPLLDEEGPGWAEDGFASGLTGLWDSISALTGKGETYAKKAAKVNALLSILKFISTYAYLKGEVKVEAPGQPLIRTKDFHAGDVRTVTAKFWIDGKKVTDWMKDHRKLVALAGLDLDAPKTGALKGVPTEWAVAQSPLVRDKLIQTTKGGPALNNLLTDDRGEAKVDWEGAPQLVVLDPKKVIPQNKQVWITVTPQVKEIKVQQDLVDAVTGAIGIRGGPDGLLTPIMEMLYRMKWKGTARLLLNVRDWQQADSIGQLNIEVQASWAQLETDSALRVTLARQLVYTDVGMSVAGGDVMPTIDPKIFNQLSPQVRSQLEAGLKAAAENAKKRQFVGVVAGSTQMAINDLRWVRTVGGCESNESTSMTTWIGMVVRPFAATGNPYDTFHISVDLDKQTVMIIADSPIKVKFVSITKQGKITGRQEKVEDMGIFTDLTLLPPFDKGPLIIPLKETKVIDSDEMNYYGAVSIPYAYGSISQFHDNILFSYSVTRKAVKKK